MLRIRTPGFAYCSRWHPQHCILSAICLLSATPAVAHGQDRFLSIACPTSHYIVYTSHSIASHLHCINITPLLCCLTLCSHYTISRIFPSPGITCLEIEPLGSAYCSRWHPQQRNTLCGLPAQHDARGSARPGSLSRHYVLSTACTTPTSHTQHPYCLSLRAKLSEWHRRLEQCSMTRSSSIASPASTSHACIARVPPAEFSAMSISVSITPAFNTPLAMHNLY